MWTYIALQNRRHKLAFAAAVLMTTAVTCVIVGTYESASTYVRDGNVHARHGHGEIRSPKTAVLAEAPRLEEDLRRLPGVVQVFPRVSFPALLSHANRTASGQGQGIDGAREAAFFHRLEIDAGNILAEEADGVMLGAGLARRLEANVGDRITVLSTTLGGHINALDLRVVGIFRSGSREFDDTTFRLQLPRAQTLLQTPQVDSMTLGLRSPDDWATVANHIAHHAPDLTAVAFTALDDGAYLRTTDSLRSQSLRLAVAMAGLLFALSFLASYAGIARSHVGLLRANGVGRIAILQGMFAANLRWAAAAAWLGILVAGWVSALPFPANLLLSTSSGLPPMRLTLHLDQALVVMAAACAIASCGASVAALGAVRLPLRRALASGV